MVFITFLSFQHWLDVTKSIKKQVKSKFTEVLPTPIQFAMHLAWKLFSPAFWNSNMFWAFILLYLSVGPPYCLHMRVKFYSSEPNNLHEELTRWIAKPPCFSLYLNEFYSWVMLAFTDQWNVLFLYYTPWNYQSFSLFISIHLFFFFLQISICATVEARRPQWEVGIFCIIIAFSPIHTTSFIKCYTQKCCICWEPVGFSRVELFSVHLLYIYTSFKHYKTLRNVKYSSY